MDIEAFKDKYEHKKVIENTNSVAKNPLVSVCIQTYQHEDYIKECLDSIIIQKTDFQFEVLLGEDASDDNTRAICISYAKRYPNKIRLFLHHRENNISIGGSPSGRFNFLYNLHNAKGKYIVLCEGDDYWTDPLKLKNQVDFLEANEGFSFCYHNVDTLNQQNQKLILNKLDRLKTITYSKNDIYNVTIPTLSVMFRNIIQNKINTDIVSEIPHGDIFIYSLLVQHGDFANLGFIAGVRRVHENGTYSGKSLIDRYKAIYITRKKMIESNLFDFKFNEIIIKSIRMKKRVVLISMAKKLKLFQIIKVVLIHNKF